MGCLVEYICLVYEGSVVYVCGVKYYNMCLPVVDLVNVILGLNI